MQPVHIGVIPDVAACTGAGHPKLLASTPGHNDLSFRAGVVEVPGRTGFNHVLRVYGIIPRTVKKQAYRQRHVLRRGRI